MRQLPKQNKLIKFLGTLHQWHTRIQSMGGNYLMRAGDDGPVCTCLPYLQNCPTVSTEDSKHDHLWVLGLQEWPCLGP